MACRHSWTQGCRLCQQNLVSLHLPPPLPSVLASLGQAFHKDSFCTWMRESHPFGFRSRKQGLFFSNRILELLHWPGSGDTFIPVTPWDQGRQCQDSRVFCEKRPAIHTALNVFVFFSAKKTMLIMIPSC